jgi:hypothetical protein
LSSPLTFTPPDVAIIFSAFAIRAADIFTPFADYGYCFDSIFSPFSPILLFFGAIAADAAAATG